MHFVVYIHDCVQLWDSICMRVLGRHIICRRLNKLLFLSDLGAVSLNPNLFHTPVSVHVWRLRRSGIAWILDAQSSVRTRLSRFLQTTSQWRSTERVQGRGTVGHARQCRVHGSDTPSPVYCGGHTTTSIRIVVVRYPIRLPRRVCHWHPVPGTSARSPARHCRRRTNVSKSGVVECSAWRCVHHNLCGISTWTSGEYQVIDGHDNEANRHDNDQDLQIERDASSDVEALAGVPVIRVVGEQRCWYDRQDCWNENRNREISLYSV